MRLTILAYLLAISTCQGQEFIGRPFRPFSASDPTVTGLTNNIAAYWKFDEASGNRIDQISGLVLTDTGGLSSTTGLFTNAILGATGKYISNNNGPVVGSGTLAFVIWIYPTDTGIAHYILDRGGAGFQDDYGLYRDAANNINWFTGDGLGTLKLVVNNTNIVANQWSMIYCDNNSTNTTVNISVNGGPTQSASAAGITRASLGVFYVNAYWNSLPGAGLNWVGRLDEYGAWTRTLTSTEITSLYNNGLGRTCCNPGFSP